MHMFSVNKAASYGLVKLAKKYKKPTREDILSIIVNNYAPDLNDQEHIGYDDDLSDYNRFQAPWTTMEKIYFSKDMLRDVKDKKEEQKIVRQLNKMFSQPRFTGMDTGLDWMKLGMDLEQRYGVDLSDFSGPYYNATPSLNGIMEALEKSPRIKA